MSNSVATIETKRRCKKRIRPEEMDIRFPPGKLPREKKGMLIKVNQTGRDSDFRSPLKDTICFVCVCFFKHNP